MNWSEYKSQLERIRNSSQEATGLGAAIGERVRELQARVELGKEDPLLSLLAGDDVAATARRTGWSTLVINPGSTSTKVAVWSGLKLLARDEVHLPPGASDSVEERASHVVRWFEQLGLRLSELTGIAARGGLTRPVPTGTYRVTEEMARDLEHAPFRHASNLSVPVALRLGALAGPDVMITMTDPGSCDERDVGYRLSGSPKVRADGAAAHYLNLHAAFALVARLLGVEQEQIHIAGCHMGGGMSAARFLEGRFVQIVHTYGNLPSANRAGALPLGEVLHLAEKRQYTFDDMRAEVVGGQGGLLGLAGTDDFQAFLAFREAGATPRQARKIELITDFFARRIAAALQDLAVTERPLDALVLTGGLARDEWFCELVRKKLSVPVPLVRVPGSLEAQALAAGLLRACLDPQSTKSYAVARDELCARRIEEEQVLNATIFERPFRRTRQGAAPKSFDEIIARAFPRGELPTIAILGADNEEAMLAAKMANQEGAYRLARFVLLGPHAAISQLAWELDVPIDEENYFIVDAADPVARATELLSAGIVDTMMKGSVTSAAMLGGYLKHLKTQGLTSKVKLSHLGLFEIPGRSKLLGVTDAAINPNPDLEFRKVILENALVALHAIGLSRPKVAVISATEKASDKVVSSVEGKEIAKAFQGRDDLIIEGPLSVDLALSPESAAEKHYAGQIQGDADLLLVPTIDVGNAVYKTLTVAGGATIAGAVIGGAVPMILTSRGDSSRSKLASIALSLLLAKRLKGVNR